MSSGVVRLIYKGGTNLDINNGSSLVKYRLSNMQNNNLINEQKDKINDEIEVSNDESDKLRGAVNNFTAILLKKMFASMRDTLPENKFLDAGFAEDVFTDMLYRRISKKGIEQQEFNSLNELLYRQLKQTEET